MKVQLAPEVVAGLRKALREARRRETGGMIFAEQLAPALFRVIDFSLDPFGGSHTHFRRDPDAHQNALNEFFDKTGRDYTRFNYLGEWHSHPSFPVAPSIEDVETMQSLVEGRTSSIAFALLLIVRLRFRLWLEYSSTTFARGHAPQPTLIGASRS